MSSREPGRTPMPSDGLIYSSERRLHWFLFLMAILFIGVGMLPIPQLPHEVEKGNWMILLVLLFPLAGFLLVWQGWKSYRGWQHYGPMPVQLQPCPGQLQGDVAGYIQVPAGQNCTGWQLSLLCVRIRISSGKNSQRRESIVWQQDQIPFYTLDGITPALRFVFSPPSGLPATDKAGRDQVCWRLVLSGPGKPYIALQRSYELPVFQGNEKALQTLPESHVNRSERQQGIAALNEAAAQMDVEQIPGGVILHSRIGRNKSLTLMVLFVGLIFSASSIWLGFQALREGGILFFMAPVFGLFGFPMVVGGMVMAGRSLDARIANGQVDTIRYWCGLALWRRNGQLVSADQLKLKSSGSSSSGYRKIVYMNLELTSGEKTIRIAEGLAGKDVAEAFRDHLLRLLKLVP